MEGEEEECLSECPEFSACIATLTGKKKRIYKPQKAVIYLCRLLCKQSQGLKQEFKVRLPPPHPFFQIT